MTRMIVALALVFTASTTAFAQQTAALMQGIRIEVTPIRGKTGTGTFRSITADTLKFVRDDATASRAALPLAQVRSVRVSTGQSHSRGFLKGALFGTGIGIATGGLIGGISYSRPDFFVRSRTESAAFGGFMLGVAGLAIGSIYGALAGSEGWKRVDLDSAAR